MGISIETPKKKKDPNRFLADLDARLKMTESTETNHNATNEDDANCHPTDVESQPQQPLQLLQSFVKSPKKMDWIREVAPQKIQESVSKIKHEIQKSASKSSDRDVELQPLNKGSCEDDFSDDEERVNKVRSSALIGARENEELMRIRQKMNADVITTALEILEKNRHYLMIAVTFIFSIWFYFRQGSNATEEEIQ